MAYYTTCPDCKANLDPGEKCDCLTVEITLPTYLTVKEVADRWKVSVDLIYSILRCGELRALRIGGRAWRIPVEFVEEYEKKNFTVSLPYFKRKNRASQTRQIITRI